MTDKNSKLRIIPLGGLGEIGKNMTVVEYGNDILLIDCGVSFPDEETLGIDLIIPDISYLEKQKENVLGVLLTHAHEDHIGALPYFLQKINVPIYGTALTLGIVATKLEEHALANAADLRTIWPGERFSLGCFEIEPIHTNHSVPDSVALAINTPIGTILATGDFKIDTTPVAGEMMDLTRIGEYGNKGILLLMSDSTNVLRDGFSLSERHVGIALEKYFKGCHERIIVAAFASNVHRIQQIIEVAAKYGRKVAISGRSMQNTVDVANSLGYLDIPESVLVELSAIHRYPKDQIVVITTGSQGEVMSALYRMANAGHRHVEIEPGDRVILAASVIPGNEKPVYRMINELIRRGADVIYEDLASIHASGHANKEELKIILSLAKPRYFFPCHGEYRHLKAHAALAEQMGVDPSDIFISENGRVLEITSRGAHLGAMVPAGKVYVDGLGVGDVGNVVLRDRKHLAQDGLIVLVVTLNSEDGTIIAGPDLVSRGFVYVREAEALLEEMRQLALDIIERCSYDRYTNWAEIKNTLKTELSSFLYQRTKRNPMILPVIMEI